MTWMRYYLSVANSPTPERVQARVAEVLGAQSEESMMSLSEVLRQEGEQRGQAKWEAKGRAEGKAQAVLSVLRARGLQPPPSEQNRIRGCTELSTLEQWVHRAVSASCLQEVFSPN